MDNSKNLVLFDLIKEEVPYSNKFLMSIFDKYTLRQKKLVLILLAGIQDKNKPLYKFNPKEIKKMLNMERQSYKEFAELILEIQKKPILIYNEEKNRLKSISLFSVVNFYLDDEYISVKFSEDAKELFLGFNENFSRYFLENIRNLNNDKSIELYLRAESFLYKNKFPLTLEEIDLFLQKKPTKNLKRSLDTIVKNINENTDIHVDFEPILNGKKVIGYDFFPKRSLVISPELQKAIEKAKRNIHISKAISFDQKTIHILLREFSENDLIRGLEFAYSKITKSFKTLSYLKKVIITSLEKENIEKIKVTPVKTEQSTNSTLEFQDVTSKHNEMEKVDLWKNMEEALKLEIEKKALELLLKEEKVNIEFIEKMKNTNYLIYIKTLSKYIVKIMDNEYNILINNISNISTSVNLDNSTTEKVKPKKNVKRGKGRPKKLDMLDELDFEEEVARNIRPMMTFLRKKLGKEEVKKMFSNFSEKEKTDFLIKNYVDFLKSKEK